jgi:hypothetical protein
MATKYRIVSPVELGTFTIDGYTIDLSAGATIDQVLTYNGTSFIAEDGGGGGTVTSIATTAPLTGGTITTSGTISIPQATTSVDGYLSHTDWNTFNGKLSAAVTSITAGTGLSGGVITSTGTISMPAVGTAGTYNYGNGSITTDAEGRVSAASSATNIITSAVTSLTNNDGYLSLSASSGAVIISLAEKLNNAATYSFGNGSISTDAYGYVHSGASATNILTGSGTNNQVAFFNGAETLTSNSHFTVSGTELVVSGHISADGYTIDMSAGATSGQVLAYNGTSFIPTAITGIGGIGGSIANTQVAFGSGTNTIEGASNFTYDGTNLFLTGYIGNTVSNKLLSSHADGSSAVAAIVDTSAAWSTAGAKLLSVRNDGTEQFAVLETGYLVFGNNATGLQSSSGTFNIYADGVVGAYMGYSGANIIINGGGINMNAGGGNATLNGELKPFSDVTYSLGDSGSRWANTWSYLYSTVVGSPISSTGSNITIAPTAGIHHVTGTGSIKTITPPVTGFVGSITLIPDGYFTTATGGNIGRASAAALGMTLIMTYDGTSWYPSY